MLVFNVFMCIINIVTINAIRIYYTDYTHKGKFMKKKFIISLLFLVLLQFNFSFVVEATSNEQTNQPGEVTTFEKEQESNNVVSISDQKVSTNEVYVFIHTAFEGLEFENYQSANSDSSLYLPMNSERSIKATTPIDLNRLGNPDKKIPGSYKVAWYMGVNGENPDNDKYINEYFGTLPKTIDELRQIINKDMQYSNSFFKTIETLPGTTAVVWYTVKKQEGNITHVDGYIAETFELKYNLAGGSKAEDDSFNPGFYRKNTSVQLASKPKKVNYVFGGWSKSDAEIYGANENVIINNNITLTAVWHEFYAKNETNSYNGENQTYDINNVIIANSLKNEINGEPTVKYFDSNNNEVTEMVNVGTYTIKLSYQTNLGKIETSATYTITPRKLKIEADSYTLEQGSEVPTLTAKVTGLIESKDALLKEKYQLTTNYTNTTVAGASDLVVTVSISDNDKPMFKNYHVDLVNGRVDVLPIPTVSPTVEPTVSPTVEPTVLPTVEPTVSPTVEPTVSPTVEPTVSPTAEPTVLPTVEPTVSPTVAPTVLPTVEPTVSPTVAPTVLPTVAPTVLPTVVPTVLPTVAPTVSPTVVPTIIPTSVPTNLPTMEQEDITQEITPESSSGLSDEQNEDDEYTTIVDEGTPELNGEVSGWSLISLLLTAGTMIVALCYVMFNKKECRYSLKDNQYIQDEDGIYVYDKNHDTYKLALKEDFDNIEKQNQEVDTKRIIGVIAAVMNIFIFVLFNDLNSPMILIKECTLHISLVFITQVVALNLIKSKKKEIINQE